MSDQSQTTLGDYLRIVRRSWLLIVLVMFGCIGVALAYSLAQTPKYEATAQLTVRDLSQDLIPIGGQGGATDLPLARASAHMPEVTRAAVIRDVQRSLGTDATLEEVRSLVTVSIDTNSNNVLIAAEADDAAEAARIANAFAEADARITSNETRADYAKTAAELEENFEQQDVASNPTAAAIAFQTLSRAQALAETARPVVVAASAQVPSSPSSPKTARNAAAAAVIGLLLGIALAYGRGMLDRKLRDPDDAEAIYKHPVLVRLRPEVFGHTGSNADAQHEVGPLEQTDSEAVRMLRENVRYLAVDRDLRTIAVTSAIPEEGKSTVAACLAIAYASAGKRTLLVECDLRRRVLAGRFGIAEAPGLSDYLVGNASPREILQLIPAPSAGANGGEPPMLTCITAGSAPPRPADLLSSSRFGDFVAKVGKVYDQVVIDCPPLLPVADTLEIVPQADAVLMCVRLNRTHRDQAQAAEEALGRLPARPTGLVVTDFTERSGRLYYYRDYYDGETPAPPAPPAATAPTAPAGQPPNRA